MTSQAESPMIARYGANGIDVWRPAQWGLFVAIGLLAVLTVSPLVWMVSAAFKESSEVFVPTLLSKRPTIANFRYVFSQFLFLRSVLNTFAGTITGVALLFHSMAAFALARLRFPGRDVIFLAIFSTLLVSFPVIIVPSFILVRQMGMVNSYVGLIIPAIFNAFGIFLPFFKRPRPRPMFNGQPPVGDVKNNK